MDETMAIYVATELRRGKAQPESDEFIAKRFFALSDTIRMIDRGTIRDGKTIAGVLWFQQHTRKPA
jgi:ADP-ribose pyrophosphatase